MDEQAELTVTMVDERRLLAQLCICRRTLYKWVQTGKFPRPIRLSDCGKRSMKRWLLREVEDWVAHRAAEREDGAPVPEVTA